MPASAARLVASDRSTAYNRLIESPWADDRWHDHEPLTISWCGSAIVRKETVLTANLETALVTGAGSGIGRSIATTLAEMGLRVALWVATVRSSSGPGRASSKAETQPSLRPATSPTGIAVKSLIDQVMPAFDSIDVLVCNAGTNVRNRSLESLDPLDWDRMIATNLTGSYNLVHHVLPSMRRRRNGLVIQICSVSGIRASTAIR